MKFSGSWAELSVSLALVQTLLLSRGMMSTTCSWLGFEIRALLPICGEIALQAWFYGQQSQRAWLAVATSSLDLANTAEDTNLPSWRTVWKSSSHPRHTGSKPDC